MAFRFAHVWPDLRPKFRGREIGDLGAAAMITAQRLNLAAWFSITNAVLGIPLLGISVYVSLAAELGGMSALGARVAIALLTVGSVALYVYVFLALRQLLETRYAFYDVSFLITILVNINVVIAVLSVLSVPFPGIEDAVSLLAVLAMVASGIVTIVLGIKLLRLPHDLHGMLKPFAYSAIGVGFCFATIFLLPVGVLVAAVNYILLAMIFFRAMEESADEPIDREPTME